MADTHVSPLGFLGRYYSARHDLGQYRSSGLTAVYHFLPIGVKDPAMWFSNILEHALQETVRDNSGLNYGITESLYGGVSAFQRLHKIDRDVVEYHDCDSPTSPDQSFREETLCQQIGWAHDALWSAGKPAWKLLVLRHGMWQMNDSSTRDGNPLRVDIGIFSHHAIADGLSILSFQRQLQFNIQRASRLGETPCFWPLVVDQNQPAPKVIEDTVDISSAAPPPPNDSQVIWAGNDIPSDLDTPFQTQVRVIELQAEDLSKVLNHCKSSKITLTGLIHGLCSVTLCRRVDEAQILRGVIPFHLRRFTKASLDDIVNQISYLLTDVTTSQLERVRESQRFSAEEWEAVVSIATKMNTEMGEALERYPDGDVVASMAKIENVYEYCLSSLGKKRTSTYELSNIGVFDPTSTFGSPLHLQKLLFTQSGMGAGPPLGFNCVTTKGGPFTVTVTWLEGVISDSLAEGVVADLNESLLTIARATK